jgi:hypothetical protein
MKFICRTTALTGSWSITSICRWASAQGLNGNNIPLEVSVCLGVAAALTTLAVILWVRECLPRPAL